MLTNVSDKCLLGWLDEAPRGHRRVGHNDVFRGVAQKAARALRLPNAYVGPIATSLGMMWGRGDLEIVNGILQVSFAKAKQRAVKPQRRPAALARRQADGVGIDAIYERQDNSEVSPMRFGRCDPRCREPWRLALAGLWLDQAPRAEVLAALCPTEIEHYGFPQELAHIEQVGGGRHVVAAPACI